MPSHISRKLDNVPNEWKLGKKLIQNTATYKYLGDYDKRWQEQTKHSHEKKNKTNYTK